MPVAPGFSQVPGNKNRYVNRNTGEVVTRHEARKRGAQALGYRSESHRSASPRANAADQSYYAHFISTDIGSTARDQAIANAHAEGRRFRESEFQSQVIAFRNGTPSGATYPYGSQAYQDFIDEYDFVGDAADEIERY